MISPLLEAELPRLARVRVQAAHAQARHRQAELLLQGRVRQVHHLDDPLGRERANRVGHGHGGGSSAAPPAAGRPRTSSPRPRRPRLRPAISVCPGQGCPAARSDSLWSGAVTTPGTRPASASATAARTRGGRRDRLLPRRPRAARRTENVHRARRERREIGQAEAPCPIGEAASGPYTTHPPAAASEARARRTISGPIPAGSPTVSASRGRALTASSRPPGGGRRRPRTCTSRCPSSGGCSGRPPMHLQRVPVVPLDRAAKLVAVLEHDDHRRVVGHLLQVVVASASVWSDGIPPRAAGSTWCGDRRVTVTVRSVRSGRMSLRFMAGLQSQVPAGSR